MNVVKKIIVLISISSGIVVIGCNQWTVDINDGKRVAASKVIGLSDKQITDYFISNGSNDEAVHKLTSEHFRDFLSYTQKTGYIPGKLRHPTLYPNSK